MMTQHSPNYAIPGVMRRMGVYRYRGIHGWGSGSISVGSFRFSRRFGRRAVGNYPTEIVAKWQQEAIASELEATSRASRKCFRDGHRSVPRHCLKGIDR